MVPTTPSNATKLRSQGTQSDVFPTRAVELRDDFANGRIPVLSTATKKKRICREEFGDATNPVDGIGVYLGDTGSRLVELGRRMVEIKQGALGRGHGQRQRCAVVNRLVKGCLAAAEGISEGLNNY